MSAGNFERTLKNNKYWAFNSINNVLCHTAAINFVIYIQTGKQTLWAESQNIFFNSPSVQTFSFWPWTDCLATGCWWMKLIRLTLWANLIHQWWNMYCQHWCQFLLWMLGSNLLCVRCTTLQMFNFTLWKQLKYTRSSFQIPLMFNKYHLITLIFSLIVELDFP